MNRGLFSSYYLAPIEFFYECSNLDEVHLDVNEHFVKQTYRSRCYIMGPNGVQCLSIPLQGVQRKSRTKDMRISNAENWQKVHWKSLEAGYRRSPYFEYYEDEFLPFYTYKFEYLIDFNESLESKIKELLGLSLNVIKSEKYISDTNEFKDFRTVFKPKNIEVKYDFPQYSQVFEDRNEFAPNLSIVDLLFNEGPNASSYLNGIKPKQH